MKNLILSIVCIALCTAVLRAQENEVNGLFVGQKVKTVVDHKLASNYFRNHIDSELASILDNLPHHPKSIEAISRNSRYLANNFSIDLATLYFTRETYQMDKNRNAQDLFTNYQQRMKFRQPMVYSDEAGDYLYVFVPGLFYKKHPETGGDFSAQLNLFASIGLRTYLIPINESGTVAENAYFISAELKKLSSSNPKIIVISASKGSPDLAYALGHLMSEEETAHIKAWISIGGVLRGSYIVEQYLSGFKGLFARAMLSMNGLDSEFMSDLNPEVSVARHNSLRFPEHLLILHYIGAPLSSQVEGKVKKNFQKLAQFGPNDGLTTLADQLTPQGIVITELGLDHYYRDPAIDKKAVALMHVVLDLLEDRKVVLGDL